MTAQKKKEEAIKEKTKKDVHALHEKYYGKKSKATKQKEVVAERVVEKQKTVAERQLPQKKGVSRNDLMLQAKEKGVKNFRVLNKEELLKVLDTQATAETIAQVVQGAVARWKSGWGKKGGRPVAQTT